MAWVSADEMLENRKHQIPQDSWPANHQRRNRKDVKANDWSPISMKLQRDAMVLKASPVFHRVSKVLAALHSLPKFHTGGMAAIYDPAPHQQVVLMGQ